MSAAPRVMAERQTSHEKQLKAHEPAEYQGCQGSRDLGERPATLTQALLREVKLPAPTRHSLDWTEIEMRIVSRNTAILGTAVFSARRT
jgi:hypothetical protein